MFSDKPTYADTTLCYCRNVNAQSRGVKFDTMVAAVSFREAGIFSRFVPIHQFRRRRSLSRLRIRTRISGRFLLGFIVCGQQ